VQHLHGWLPGGLEPVEAGAGEVIRAYQDIGMRVSYAFAFRDRIRRARVRVAASGHRR
jgi:hypothetical protein